MIRKRGCCLHDGFSPRIDDDEDCRRDGNSSHRSGKARKEKTDGEKKSWLRGAMHDMHACLPQAKSACRRQVVGMNASTEEF